MKIELSVYKVLCFTETWLSDSHSSSVYFPSNFTTYRFDRIADSTRRSGGVAILVHRSLKSESLRLDIATDPECEFVAVEVAVDPKPVIYFVCYMSTFDHRIALKLYKRIEFIISKYRNHRIIIIGDFNLHDIVWTHDDDNQSVYLPHANVDLITSQRRSRYNENALDFLHKMMELPLFQMSNYRNSANNVLDLLFVNDPDDIVIAREQQTIIDSTQQDEYHIPIEIDINCTENSTTNIEYSTIYRYASGNYQRMCQQLEAVNFQHEFNARDVDSAFGFFHCTLNELIEQNVPKATFKLYSNKPKWWTPELQRRKNRRDKLYKRKLNGESIDEYEIALREFNDLCDRRQSEHILRIQENVKSDPKEFWNFAKISNGSTTYPNEMHYNDRVSRTQVESVNLFADYFESIYVHDEQPWHFDDIYHPLPNAIDVNITLYDIESAIHSIKWKSGAGPDELSPFVIKMCASAIVWPIWLLLQKSIDVGKIPEALKMSRVTPVHKKGDKANVTNYRVIAISSIIMKIHEIAMKQRLSLIVEPQLSNAQHGFRPGRSVVTNLLNLSMLAHKAFEKANQIDVFYGDFKTAFDTVWLRRLVEKIASFNVGSKTAKWLCEFVTSRKNFVKIGKMKSRVYSSPSGVPAGSTLGPLLFTMFINDIVDVVEFVIILLFADDIKAVLEIREVNGRNNASLLQRDINNLMRWCALNRLFFNISKCVIFSAYRDNARFIDVTYTMNDQSIERRDEIRDLGVLLDRRFTFGHHIEQITIKCRQLVGCIKRYSNGNFTKDTQRILYLAYVRSRLEFASIIWNPYLDIYIEDIESIQKQFVIYLLESRRNAFSFRLSPYNERCKLVDLENLELRRKTADAVFAFDIYSGNINDVNITSKFVHINNDYSLRNTTVSLLEEPCHFLEYLINQPIVRLIKSINNYKPIVRICTSREAFKFRIFKEIMNPTIVIRRY